jgi:hypothetical protein
MSWYFARLQDIQIILSVSHRASVLWETAQAKMLEFVSYCQVSLRRLGFSQELDLPGFFLRRKRSNATGSTGVEPTSRPYSSGVGFIRFRLSAIPFAHLVAYSEYVPYSEYYASWTSQVWVQEAEPPLPGLSVYSPCDSELRVGVHDASYALQMLDLRNHTSDWQAPVQSHIPRPEDTEVRVRVHNASCALQILDPPNHMQVPVQRQIPRAEGTLWPPQTLDIPRNGDFPDAPVQETASSSRPSFLSPPPSSPSPPSPSSESRALPASSVPLEPPHPHHHFLGTSVLVSSPLFSSLFAFLSGLSPLHLPIPQAYPPRSPRPLPL